MPRARFALLLDGGFVTKKLFTRLESNQRVVMADHVVDLTTELINQPALTDYELLRIHFYDAYPSRETIKLPISGLPIELAKTERFRNAQALYDGLIHKPRFALRMGGAIITPAQWRLKPRVERELKRRPRTLTDQDFDLDIVQKGVDLRIGLDIARLALRDMVRAIVVVSGDSDLVPAFKFARREGVTVILARLGHHVRRNLEEHADIVL